MAPMPPPGMDMLSGPPPAAMPPQTFQSLAGQPQQPGGDPTGQMSGGMSQIASSAVRMAMEIDQALKVLAQQIPSLLPWAEKTTLELRAQLGQALNAGAMPTSPVPAGRDAQAFPDGGGRL